MKGYSINMTFSLEFLIKVLMAVAVGGIIGLERETVKRPAGLRTHMLVCAASAMVMDINLIIVASYPNADPMRLGAQVISGMGFLGAGTIIKEGINVKGLTTAAGLWSVACLGLVIGAGQYLMGGIAAVIMFLILKVVGKLEKRFSK